ncbi:MAG: hypothetical protein AB7K36_04830 [Chloroflexota bacterium]
MLSERFELLAGWSSAQIRRLAWTTALGVGIYGILAPVLAVVHELIVLATAHLIGDLAWEMASGGLLRALPFDPIYTSAMLLTLGGIEPRGLALAPPIGAWLHEHWSAFFQAPALVAPLAWASAIVAPGSTIISRWLCGIVADSALVAFGLLAMKLGRDGRRWLVIVGAIVQAHVVVTHLIDAPPLLAEVEAAGIPFAVAMIFSGDVQAGPRLAVQLEAMADPLRNTILGLVFVALAYVPVLGCWALYRSIGALFRQTGQPTTDRWLWLRGLTRQLRGWPAYNLRSLELYPARIGRLIALTALSLAVAVSPLGDLADAQTHFLAASVDGDAETHEMPPVAANGEQRSGQPGTPGAASTDETVHSALSLAVSPSPSVVAVSGSGYQYRYTVNGVPEVIRGIGYNVRYRRLPDEERARRLDRDFAALRQAGVNTVFGWEPTEFDTVLLDAAHRHGLGVAPPFHLDPDAAYGDPAVRAQITRDVLAWVEKYRDHPSLRMWAIGNEVLHKLVYPSWMPMRSDPAWEQRARDFASFYVELIDKVRAADPNHPIVHRDAEDAYLTWLRDALAGTGRRPWFIYGVNTYTPRLAEILTSWPSQGWDVPLLVSEFAPGGMSPADRPQGLRDMWKMIRGANGWVLGGSVYAWTTDGPEEVDRVFGLVDENGSPVDGAFSAISAVYRGAARQVQTERAQPGQVKDGRIWVYARHAIRMIQQGHSVDLLPATADTSIMGDVNNVSQELPEDSELVIQRVRDSRRVAWSLGAGVVGEWWVSWFPSNLPGRKLTFVVQEHQDGTLGVQYIYHGPR